MSRLCCHAATPHGLGRCGAGSAEVSWLALLNIRHAVAIRGIKPAFEIRRAFFGEGSAAFQKIGLVAMLMQLGGQGLLRWCVIAKPILGAR